MRPWASVEASTAVCRHPSPAGGAGVLASTVEVAVQLASTITAVRDRRSPVATRRAGSHATVPATNDPADGAEQLCPSCGHRLQPGARFCISCGAARGEPAAPRPDAAAAAGAADTGPSSPTGGQVAVDTTPPPASGRGATRTCTSCGAVNPRVRELCRACGLDLDPEDRTSVAARPPARVPRPARRLGRRGRWWVPILAVVVAIPAVAVTVLFVAGLGPFAGGEQEPLDPVPFPEERYPVLGEPLALTDVATLTAAPPEGDRVFRPQGMVDGDPTTAWRSEVAALPAEAHETIDLVLERPAWITGIAISNGDHRDRLAYARSGRIRTATLVFDGGVRITAQLRDLGRQRQLITLHQPMLSTAVRLELEEVIAGEVNPGAAVSSIEVRGHPADAQDVTLAEARAAQRPAAGTVVLDARRRVPAGLPWSGAQRRS